MSKRHAGTALIKSHRSREDLIEDISSLDEMSGEATSPIC